MERRSRSLPAPRIGALAVAAAVAVGLLAGGVAAHAPSVQPTTVLTVYQTPDRLTEQGNFSVWIQVADSSNIDQVYFTFCQLTSPLCYLPIVMSAQGDGVYVGTTGPMTEYNGMAPGVQGGFNITIQYTDNSTSTEPQLPNPFSNLTVVQSVTGEHMFLITVSQPVFDLSGTVYAGSSGVALAGANVTVTPGTGLTALTNSTGGYSFSDLLNGTYSVAVSKDGYTGQTVSVTVSGANVQKDLTLAETGGGNTGPTTKNPGGSGASPNFLSTPTGIASIAVVVVVVVAAIGAAVVLARRKRGAGGSRPSDPAGSPPPDGPNGG